MNLKKILFSISLGCSLTSAYCDEVALYGQIINNGLPLGMDPKKIFFYGPSSGFWQLTSKDYATLNYSYTIYDVERTITNSICQVNVNFNDNNFSNGTTYYINSFNVIASDAKNRPTAIRMTNHPSDTISITNLSTQSCYLITDNSMLMVKATSITSDEKDFEIFVSSSADSNTTINRKP